MSLPVVVSVSGINPMVVLRLVEAALDAARELEKHDSELGLEYRRKIATLAQALTS